MAQKITDDLSISLNSQLYKLKSPLYAQYISPLTGKVNVGDSSLDNQVNLNTWIIKDQTGGAGVMEMDESVHQDRYWWGNCITEQKGHLFLPRLASTVTLPTTTAVTITNADMELDASWTNGIRSTDQKHAGTYSMKAALGVTVYQDQSWTTQYQGRVFTFKLWMHASNGSIARCGINDGVGTTWSSYHSGGGTWEQLTVTRQLDASSTRLRLQFINESGAVNTVYGDDATIVYPAIGTILMFCNLGTNTYLASGNCLCKLNTSTGATFDYVYSFDSTITYIVNSEGGNLYIFLGDSDNYWYMSSAEAFTDTNVANAYWGIHWDSKLFKINSSGA